MEEKTRCKLLKYIQDIEFMGSDSRKDEVASIYSYLGMDSNIMNGPTPFIKKTLPCYDGLYVYNNLFGQVYMNMVVDHTHCYEFTTLRLPKYDITVRDGNPVELMYFLTQKKNEFKKKYDAVNAEVVSNRKLINNAKKNRAEMVEVVDDFLGCGNRLVTDKDFKAYITGLSVANHRLKKKAKHLFSDYILIDNIQNMILEYVIQESNFEKFYDEYAEACRRHHKDDRPHAE